MAKKGKKLWRKIIDTQKEEKALADASTRERHGPAVKDLPNNQLFFVDKEQDKVAAFAISRGAQISKKKEKKPLKCQMIINAAHQAKPLSENMTMPRKRKATVSQSHSHPKTITGNVVRGTSNAVENSIESIWEDGVTKKPKIRKKSSIIRAVEVDMPGCSFNPEFEQHQDALAAAVAAEMTKVYEAEHVPKQLKVPVVERDELDELLVEVDDAEVDEEENEDDDDEDVIGVNKRQPRTKTQADRNRQLRHRLLLKEEARKKFLKKQLHDLNNLKNVNKEILKKEEHEEAVRIRRETIAADKAAEGPPKLGKYKFKPANVQVLLSSEVDGSLRRLKASPFLTTDRYKSVQKRGIIEPRVRLEPKLKRRKYQYQTGDRVDKIKANHESLMELVRENARTKKEKGVK